MSASATPWQVVAEAREWIGPPYGKSITKWQHQAFQKGIATDCLGLVGGVALALDLPGAREWADTPAYHNYGREPDPALLLAGCDRLMIPIALSEIRLADVLVMAFRADPQHFAIVSADDPRYLIHAYASARRVVEQGAAVANTRLLRAYRYRGVI